ncbi:MAG: cob(I)yrinic acid a,c-diamide adenosyltransferase [Treponema sp.]|jgi:cob(I)alamin adenosyltransferase|nr:cob(I)yrinic acid a,c-diamide adenosyltransferase [Treponema sp.]
MSICTKSGDDGNTELIGGRRVPKDHPLIECLGTIDELNAFLGRAKAALCEDSAGGENQAAQIITGIQKDIFALSGVLAGGAGIVSGGDRLYQLITELEADTPPFSGFAVPGTDPVSADIHIARTVCRRAERQLVTLSRAAGIEAGILPYFNRLSDLLFLLARRQEYKKSIADNSSY